MRLGRWLSSAGLVMVMLACTGLVRGETYVELGPMLGHVGPNEARIWLKASGPAMASVVVGREADLSDGETIQGEQVALADTTARMGTVRVEGLEPSTRYYYAVTLDGHRRTAPPYPSFTTAPPAGQPVRLRVAF